VGVLLGNAALLAQAICINFQRGKQLPYICRCKTIVFVDLIWHFGFVTNPLAGDAPIHPSLQLRIHRQVVFSASHDRVSVIISGIPVKRFNKRSLIFQLSSPIVSCPLSPDL
jgi:hypothetical protein